ncbi:hypothetical protein EGR_10959 [Echinococcus granulosus]|uniref:Uncharacterized protein n=1 Tax=Echinococcus granulosus TaxID=6210 RepID=W6U131_ECHGR|nr:hypothetical protein EGR_10959 [Echinococcus granulosus]EUB54181.1 hypothetical protein EGR_10959 [Echinococcus granulosus]
MSQEREVDTAMNSRLFLLPIICPRLCVVSWPKTSSLLTCASEQA